MARKSRLGKGIGALFPDLPKLDEEEGFEKQDLASNKRKGSPRQRTKNTPQTENVSRETFSTDNHESGKDGGLKGKKNRNSHYYIPPLADSIHPSNLFFEPSTAGLGQYLGDEQNDEYSAQVEGTIDSTDRDDQKYTAKQNNSTEQDRVDNKLSNSGKLMPASEMPATDRNQSAQSNAQNNDKQQNHPKNDVLSDTSLNADEDYTNDTIKSDEEKVHGEGELASAFAVKINEKASADSEPEANSGNDSTDGKGLVDAPNHDESTHEALSESVAKAVKGKPKNPSIQSVETVDITGKTKSSAINVSRETLAEQEMRTSSIETNPTETNDKKTKESRLENENYEIEKVPGDKAKTDSKETADRKNRKKRGNSKKTDYSGRMTAGKIGNAPIEEVGDESENADSSKESNDDLLPVAGGYLAELSIEQISPNEKQPRTIFDDDELAELAESIKQVGVLQPVVVRKRDRDDDFPTEYELIMGERRLRASKLAGLKTIPAIVRTTSDNSMLRDALLENLHRVALNPLEEAAAYQQMMEDFGLTQEQLSQSISKSRPQISNTLRLLQLPASVQKKVASGVLSAGHARALLALPSGELMESLANRIVAEELSVRTTEEIIALQAGKKKSQKRQRADNAWADAPEIDELANYFETKVKIKGTPKKGRIEITFASVDDLHRIMSIIQHGALERYDASEGKSSEQGSAQKEDTRSSSSGQSVSDGWF
ncbi:chromosome partitioning protein [Scardovia inopinata]|uniref:ParB-like partition protein n=1 Tax=Scardovia inopinata F0304 TaxID=641146 RepID=W5II03_SCAIO|nr:ParB-like partition protein [Scardovia inopinata F0304]BAR07506.1 putative chromosome partitioning protein ParB [Scardovia inopinata JCM 12537]SUV51579.1 chromosome partitioning protein [Scardovia inopinata]